MNQVEENIYRERFRGTESARDGVWKVLSGFFRQWIDPAATVLDLGAGYCEFINNVCAAKKFALDLNPSTLARAAADVHVFSQDVTKPWPLPASSVNVVFTSNFLEHLPDKKSLRLCLDEARRVLRPGGALVAMGPNIRFCYDVYWDFIDHALPLSDRSLCEALTLAGFHIEKVVPRFLPYTMAGRKPNPELVRLYLALPFFWRFLGKQFLVVARAPNE